MAKTWVTYRTRGTNERNGKLYADGFIRAVVSARLFVESCGTLATQEARDNFPIRERKREPGGGKKRETVLFARDRRRGARSEIA